MNIMNLAPKVALVSILLSVGTINAGGVISIPQRTVAQDKDALIELENTWLKGEHDAAVLERVLAPDFVHPVVTGDFLTNHSTSTIRPGDCHRQISSNGSIS